MSLNYTTVQALINSRYLPVLYDNIFAKNHYVTAKLKAKAKEYKDRKIVVPLEYANGSNAQATAQYGTINLSPIEIATAAEFEPKMITDSLVISLEEELTMNSEMAVKNILDAKMKNVQKGLELYFARRFWARTTGTTEWNSLYTVNGAGTFGGIAIADMALWQTPIFDATGLADDPTVESNLIDPAKTCYIKKLLQKGIAMCKAYTGENPDIISVSQYLWDLIELILDPQKTGSKMSERAGAMGFNALDYRGIDIVADDDMVYAQTGDTDGYMEFINTNYLYMFFNPGAKFKAQEFIRAANQNAKSCLINAYGNLVTSNRTASSRIINVRSPKTYASGS